MAQGAIRGYKDLVVWQHGMALVEHIYAIARRLPACEQFGLTAQPRRAAVSVPSNIAEGYGRHATGEYRHHLLMSRGSLFEVETQLLLCVRLGYADEAAAQPALDEIRACGRMLASLLARLH
jgi:four helix bundle protein